MATKGPQKGPQWAQSSPFSGLQGPFVVDHWALLDTCQNSEFLGTDKSAKRMFGGLFKRLHVILCVPGIRAIYMYVFGGITEWDSNVLDSTEKCPIVCMTDWSVAIRPFSID